MRKFQDIMPEPIIPENGIFQVDKSTDSLLRSISKSISKAYNLKIIYSYNKFSGVSTIKIHTEKDQISFGDSNEDQFSIPDMLVKTAQSMSIGKEENETVIALNYWCAAKSVAPA